MPLLQISEPSTEPVAQQNSGVAAAIDLGTTHSLIAHVKNGAPHAITIDGSVLVPSAVYIDASATVHVGRKALVQAQKDNKAHDVIRSFKRLFGKQDAHVPFPHPLHINKDGLCIEVSGKRHTPRVLASHLLHYLVSAFEQQTACAITTLVITVPAYFDDSERADVLAAAQAIGFSHVSLLSEPTAAALAYGLQKQVTGCVMVYDFGGGTFDVSLLTMQDDLFTVRAVGGDTKLGGDDCDIAIATLLAHKQGTDYSSLDAKQKQDYIKCAQLCKERLHKTTIAHIEDDVLDDVQLSLAEINHAIAPLIERTIALCKQTLTDAQYNNSDIDDIVMVGGSSRLSLAGEQVQATFGHAPLMTLDPDQVVVLGAAMHSQELHTQEQGILLLDVTPLSLGLETMGGLMEVIIPRNSTIPIQKCQEFTTYKSGQTAMKITIYQGERSLVADNRLLGAMTITDIPPLPIGIAKVAVDFALDANGVLTVSAQETSQGAPISMQLIPTQEIDATAMMRMLAAAHENFAADTAVRMRSEAVFAAQQILDMLQKALIDDGDLLQENEQTNIMQQATQLQESIANGEPADTIRQHTDTLDQMASRFMQTRMDRDINQSLAGTSVDGVFK